MIPRTVKPLGSMPQHSQKSTPGFTLLEVTIGMSILSVLTLSTLLTLIPLSQQNRLSREAETAVAEVRNVLEKIQSVPFSDVVALYPDGTTIAIPGVSNGQITINYANPAADPLEIQLNLSWDSQDHGLIGRSFFAVRTE
ncbi:MAG: prepilin-type N-terminal cleavage/methylation domain-containing protein [Planctomycetota bacterium]